MGQGLIFTVDNSSKPSINLTGGPLSYKYEWHQMALHFGLNNQSGSEHMIAGRAFPAEVSVMGSYRRQKSIENRPRKTISGRHQRCTTTFCRCSIIEYVYNRLRFFSLSNRINCWRSSCKFLDSTLNCTALTAKRSNRRTASSHSPFSSRYYVTSNLFFNW